MKKLLAGSIRTGMWCLLCGLLSNAASAQKVLFDFERGFNVHSVVTRDTTVSVHQRNGNAVLKLVTGHRQDWPGITLTAPKGRWDLSRFAYVHADVVNVGANQAELGLRVDSLADDGQRVSVTGHATLEPGEEKALIVALSRRLPSHLSPKLFGMRGYPGGFANESGLDPANVDQLLIFASTPSDNYTLQIDNIRAVGSHRTPDWLNMSEEQFFPMIDQFGQFAHKTWLGKIESEDKFAVRAAAESDDLAKRPGMNDWNQYGGWKAGPQLQASGHFRVAKHGGKWWLVDPEGRLFWSHGIDCVRWTTGYTPITDREFLFANLPDRDSAHAEFYGRGSGWAPPGYYHGKQFETYNFTGANLFKKYGADWKATFDDLCHRRLRSWGMNTIGNWSDADVYLMRKTPYVATLGTGKTPLEGSSGYWGKFPDVFDPEFRNTLVKGLEAAKGKTTDDPWCIGYFVDNELSWGDEMSLAVATLASPAEQAAKKVFLADLRKKYDSINQLNASWGMNHESWDALLQSTAPPDQQKARDDLLAFYTKTAEQYFRTCAEAIEQVATNKLYLGCRFAWDNDSAVRAAAKYCDVVSFNRYRTSVADFQLPVGVDMPAIIGEFHFGALDRGMFHTGLQPVDDQAARAAAYTNYVVGALKNQWLVGTHWFQYGEQATTGRADGENYQIGFLDICDTPYSEIIEASRDIGARIYRLRSDASER